MDLTNSYKRVGLVGLIVIFLVPSESFAGEFGGGISIGVSQTDNVFLDVSPTEIDDIVYQASPWLTFIHESPQFDANLRYEFDWFRYKELDTTTSYHRGNASVTARAWDDSLALELGAQRSQVIADPADVIQWGRLPLSGNLIDQDELWINPQLNRSLGSTVTVDMNYRYSHIQYDDPQIQDNENQSGIFSLENYKAGQGLTWALRYDWRRTEYEVSPPWEYQQVTAELGVWVSKETRIFGAGGEESAWDNPFDSTLEDSFWEAGFAYSPSENVSAEFAVGERSYGDSWRGKLDYNFRTGSMSVSYNELPASIGFDSRRETLGDVDSDFSDDYLDRPGAAERFLSKRLQWSLNLVSRKTGFDLSLFSEDRSRRINAIGTPLDDQRQTGVMASFRWQLGVRTELVAMGAVIDQELGTEDRSKFVRAGLDVNYSIGRRSEISLRYSYDEQDPSGIDASNRDYIANVVSLFFTMTM